MNQYAGNVDPSALAHHLLDHDKLMIVTHAKPDGDAVGSVLALTQVLTAMRRSPRALLVPPVHVSLTHLPGFEQLTVLNPDVPVPDAADFDGIVVLDTGAWGQLGSLAELLKPHVDRTAIVDHHLSGDIQAPLRLINGQAAACCEIVAKVIDAMAQAKDASSSDATVAATATVTATNADADSASSRAGAADVWADPLSDPVIASALFTGIASDTGWFRFSNTSPTTHELAARLRRLGVDHAALYQLLEQTERPHKIQLMIRALQSMTLLADERVAMMVLTRQDFQDTGATLDETERLIDIPQVLDRVQVVALITEPSKAPGPESGRHDPRVPNREAIESAASAEELDKPMIRISLRSKPGDEAVNVAQLAARLGGGGHARAAGAKIHAPLHDVVEQVRCALVESL